MRRAPCAPERLNDSMACNDNGKTPAREAPITNKPVITSGDLFAGRRELHIVHNQELYTLRITTNDKLILTK